MQNRASLRASLPLKLGLILLLASCAPASAVWTAPSLTLFFSVLLYAALTFAGAPAPPPPCDGSVSYYCSSNGRRVRRCCPKGARCNYRYSPHVDCGYGNCVSGKDKTRCPVHQPMIDHSKSKTDCSKHNWQKACVDGKVKTACLMSLPTNYMGPPRNPSFLTCEDARCTTGPQKAACRPSRADLKNKRCKGTWKKACIAGKVEERCFPKNDKAPATSYALCSDKSCVVGQSTCP